MGLAWAFTQMDEESKTLKKGRLPAPNQSAPYKRQQIRINRIGMGGRHAVREAWVDFQRAVFQQFGG